MKLKTNDAKKSPLKMHIILDGIINLKFYMVFDQILLTICWFHSVALDRTSISSHVAHWWIRFDSLHIGNGNGKNYYSVIFLTCSC